jgi:flavin-dependent dehydrogenase
MFIGISKSKCIFIVIELSVPYKVNSKYMVYDVAVIGAGPAGAAIASLLVQNSYSTVILEKSIFPRFAIGESLLPQSMSLLDKCGLLKALPTDAFQIKKGAIFKKNNQHALIDFSHKFTDGPGTTWQVLREEFDSILINTVKDAGAEVFFDTAVNNVEFQEDIVTLECNDKTIKSRFVVDASGNAMVLPRLMKTVSKPVDSKTSMFRHLVNDNRSDEEAENILISINPEKSDIWYWGIPLPNGRISVGITAGSQIMESSLNIEEQFSKLIQQEPNIAKRLQNAVPISDISTINAYSSSVESIYSNQHLVIGNAGGFIDPIFSSGLTVALKSAVCGFERVNDILSGNKADWQGYEREMKIGNNTFKAYVEAWYDQSLQNIIFAENKNEIVQSKINSILAGYAWDTENSFVREPKRKLKQLNKLMRE